MGGVSAAAPANATAPFPFLSLVFKKKITKISKCNFKIQSKVALEHFMPQSLPTTDLECITMQHRGMTPSWIHSERSSLYHHFPYNMVPHPPVDEVRISMINIQTSCVLSSESRAQNSLFP